MMLEDEMGTAEYPYDATKYGPLCSQGTLTTELFENLNSLVINDLIDKVLEVTKESNYYLNHESTR